MNKEEKGLEKWGDDLNAISVPNNLDDYVRAGIEKGKRSQKGQFQKRWFRTSIVVAAVLLLFSFCVRLSPAFAKSISHVPGLSYLVHLINGDPSLQQAVQNNYIQKLGLTETHGQTNVTLDSLVADRHRLVLFYRVESVKDHTDKKDPLMTAMLYEENGNVMPVSIGYDQDLPSKTKSNLHKMDIDLLYCKDRQLEKPFVLKIKQKGETWTFNIPYDLKKMKALKKVYPVNQTVSMEGQRLTFNSVTVYPTGSAVDVTYDPKNTKQITHLDDLRLVDNKGNVYASVKNGLLASGAADSNHQILYLDSNYFTQPKSLHLELTRVRAIDKKEQEVVVSLKGKKLLKAPSDHRIVLKMISSSEQSSVNRVIEFTVKLPKMDVNQGYQILEWAFKDATGKTHIIREVADSGPDNSHPFSDIQFFIPSKLSYKDPLTFHIIDYPTRIYGKVDLKLK